MEREFLAADVEVGTAMGEIGCMTGSERRGIFDGRALLAMLEVKCDLEREGVRKTGKVCACCGQGSEAVDPIGSRVPFCLPVSTLTLSEDIICQLYVAA